MVIRMHTTTHRGTRAMASVALGAAVLLSQCAPLHEGKMCTGKTGPAACPQAIQDVQNRLTCSDGKRIVLTDVWETGKKPDVLTLFVKDGSSAYGVQLKIKNNGKDSVTVELTAKDGTTGLGQVKRCGPNPEAVQDTGTEEMLQEEIDDQGIPAGME